MEHDVSFMKMMTEYCKHNKDIYDNPKLRENIAYAIYIKINKNGIRDTNDFESFMDFIEAKTLYEEMTARYK